MKLTIQILIILNIPEFTNPSRPLLLLMKSTVSMIVLPSKKKAAHCPVWKKVWVSANEDTQPITMTKIKMIFRILIFLLIKIKNKFYIKKNFSSTVWGTFLFFCGY